MTALGSHTKKHKVAVIGSGNWGSTISKVVAENVIEHPSIFEKEVHMWVFEEDIILNKTSAHYDSSSELCSKPQKLSFLINQFHENVKYLPGVRLPNNLVGNPSLVDACKGASILIFNLPHQFLKKVCADLKGNILPYARAISCIKGVEVSEKGVSLLSDTIGESLGIYCGALSGANIASEIAQGKWSESTVAYDPPAMDSMQPTPGHLSSTSAAALFTREVVAARSKTFLNPLPAEYPPLNHQNIKRLFHRPYFHINMVHDVAGVSLGGALKNIVALAAGFVDGLGWGDNAKAAVMRVGILEEVKFGKLFFPESASADTFTSESCGVADIITSCMGGRNFRCAKMAVERGLTVNEVEKTELNGQVLQGTSTAHEVNEFLRSQGKEEEFPLFTAVHRILEGEITPEDIPRLIENR